MAKSNYASNNVSKLAITIEDDVHIVVPNVGSLLTPYVLLEQGDWFEDEIKFLRTLLECGERVIDIGANYGTYTLSMSKTVGPDGRVWAFEPASQTAGFLAESIRTNGFKNVTLIQSAVSRTRGTATLLLKKQSEANALLNSNSIDEADDRAMQSEEVQLVSLDDCMADFQWSDIALVKLDAEGEELDIIKGGRRFFQECSPLVQYEVNESGSTHFELVDTFAAIGYQSYRLMPGLDILAPWDRETESGEFVLNLFACKPGRAATLASRGLLVTKEQLTGFVNEEVDRLSASRSEYRWNVALGRFPYGRDLASVWEGTIALGDSRDVCKALAMYAISQCTTASSPIRLIALRRSKHLLIEMCQENSAYQRHSSLARVAWASGDRLLALNSLSVVIRKIEEAQKADLREPFLVPDAHYENIAPNGDYANWILSAAVEAYERARALSSFYTGRESLKRLETIIDLGFCSNEMRRRCDLIRDGYGQPSLLAE
ncbi:MAG: FkbM family methyltransferase [Pirellulaceae bacterium]|nr:FkbM family methyltransferase [Pirellulaceae bacterium]